MKDKYYYTIFRQSIGFPHDPIDLSDEEECFAFDTEQEANECLKLIFDNGNWIDDIQYGKVRYYVERVTEKLCNIYDDISFDIVD